MADKSEIQALLLKVRQERPEAYESVQAMAAQLSQINHPLAIKAFRDLVGKLTDLKNPLPLENLESANNLMAITSHAPVLILRAVRKAGILAGLLGIAVIAYSFITDRSPWQVTSGVGVILGGYLLLIFDLKHIDKDPARGGSYGQGIIPALFLFALGVGIIVHSLTGQ